MGQDTEGSHEPHDSAHRNRSLDTFYVLSRTGIIGVVPIVHKNANVSTGGEGRGDGRGELCVECPTSFSPDGRA